MAPAARRKFQVLDGMILMCPTAIALCWFIANGEAIHTQLVPTPTAVAPAGKPSESRRQRAPFPDYWEENPTSLAFLATRFGLRLIYWNTFALFRGQKPRNPKSGKSPNAEVNT